MRTTAARSAAKSSCRQPAAMPPASRSKLALAIATALSGTAAMHGAPASGGGRVRRILQHPRGSHRHRPQAHGELAGRSDQHRRLHEQGPAESLDLAVRRLRHHDAVHFLRQRRPRHADLRHARRVGRQQSELRERSHDRVPGRRHVDELLRHDARSASLRYRADRGAERSAGNDVRRGRHGRRPALHHQQAGSHRRSAPAWTSTAARSTAAPTTAPPKASSTCRSSPTGRRCAFPPTATITADTSTISTTRAIG